MMSIDSCVLIVPYVFLRHISRFWIPYLYMYHDTFDIYEILDLSIVLCACLKMYVPALCDVSVVIFSSCMCRCSCVLLLISHMYDKDLNVFVKICDTWIDHM